MLCSSLVFFFFNDTATTEIYTLSLHDALPISVDRDLFAQKITQALEGHPNIRILREPVSEVPPDCLAIVARSEEHTSELQSRLHLVCRLLLEKKKKSNYPPHDSITEHECGQET